MAARPFKPGSWCSLNLWGRLKSTVLCILKKMWIYKFSKHDELLLGAVWVTVGSDEFALSKHQDDDNRVWQFSWSYRNKTIHKSGSFWHLGQTSWMSEFIYKRFFRILSVMFRILPMHPDHKWCLFIGKI